MKKNLFYSIAVAALAFLTLASCGKDGETNSTYNGDYQKLVTLGYKSGLTSGSAESAFSSALSQTIAEYTLSNPTSLTQASIDGITYLFVDMQTVSGNIPDTVWDLFWEKADKYTSTIGYCWGFISVDIASKGASGVVYRIYTITTNDEGDIHYIAQKGKATPM